MRLKKTKIILLVTLLVGTLDGLAAIIQFIFQGGDNPLNVFRFIASGIYGNSAFSDGLKMPLLGILFHYLIAGIWVFLFFEIYSRIKPKWTNKYISGILYGIVIWLIMNLVVLPLSNTAPLPQNLLQNSIGILILIITVGLPISVIQDKTHRSRASKREPQFLAED